MAPEFRRCGLPEMLHCFFAQVHPGAKPYLRRFGFMNTLTGSGAVSATAVRGRSRVKKIFPFTGSPPT